MNQTHAESGPRPPHADRTPRAHVLMLVSNDGSHDPRVRNEALSLAAAGYAVSVVGWDRRGQSAPHTDQGIAYHPVRGGLGMRLLGTDLFRLPSWWRRAVAAARRIHVQRRVDVIHAHDLDVLPAGVRLKRALGVPLVFDAHEIYPVMLRRELPWPLPGLFARLERRLLPSVDRIITVNEPLATHYRKTGAPVTVVMNAKRLPRHRAGPGRGAVYIGTLEPGRLCVELVQAFADSHVPFRIGGIGKPAYARRVQAAVRRAPACTYLGRVPYDAVLDETRAAAVVICPIDPDDPNNALATTNKQFEAMACGRPIIVSAGTYAATLTQQLGVGLVVRHDAQAFRDAAERLLEHDEGRAMGRRAREHARRTFNWTQQEARLLALYDELTRTAPGTGRPTGRG